jgi:hypothetical protein
MTDSVLDEIQDGTFARATGATLRAFPEDRRLTGTRLTGYLDRHSVGVISSTRPDGRPHATPATYIRSGAVFWLPTFAGTVRERNVRAVPWLVLVVAEGDSSEHVTVIVEGAGAIVHAAGAPAGIVATFAKRWVSAWLRLDAERLLSYADAGTAG